MGLHYTRLQEDLGKDEKTMNATEFIERLISSQRIPDKKRQENNIESIR